MRRFLSRRLARHPALFAAAKQICYRLGGTIYRSETDWLRSTFRDHPGVFFLQIGANDGKTDDYIYPFVRSRAWRGVLVEPVRYLFDRLVANYEGVNGLGFENAAMAEQEGKTTIFRLRETDDPLPGFYQQLGSLRREVVASHRSAIPNIDDYMVEERVNCISFKSIVEKYNIQSLDLLLIDTEGYDLNILRTVDFNRFHPALIIYEEKHLSPADKIEARRLLGSWGYVVHEMGANAAATRTAFWRAAWWRRPGRVDVNPGAPI